MKSKIIDQVSGQLDKLFSNQPVQDIEENIKAIVLSYLRRLDVVTKEEFDIQQRLLIATRQKVDELEAKINQLLKP